MHALITRRSRLAAVVLVAASLAPAVAEPTLAERLARLEARLEEARQEHHVPGMALAVVRNDEVILSRGFGVANVETSTPATAETIFAIGSSTKAFTATLIGILADEGRMSFDDPVSTWLPVFTPTLDLPDGEAGELLIRDALSHRSGFSRSDLLWASNRLSRDEVLVYAGRAQAADRFRAKFNYNNVMFLAAGMAAGNAAHSDWETLIRERILTPLGMTSTTLSIQEAQADPRLALGYTWDDATQSFKHLPMRDLHAIAPAGSINSNVIDMAQWVRLQLAHGELGGVRIVSDAAIDETRTPHVDITPGMHYGLGWFLREWEGRTVVEHGGNIDGFAAQVALLPDEHLGFVLLTNTTISPLQGLSQQIVWDAMLGEWENAAPAAELDLASLVGTYHANVGVLRDTTLTVLEKDGKLALDVPGQRVYDLNPPDETGKWAFADMPQAIQVSFARDEQGQVTALVLHQGGGAFECPRVGVERKADLTDAEAAKYFGEYSCPEIGLSGTVLMQNGRLAIDIPGQTVFELRLPDADGKWAFRFDPNIALRFNEQPDGSIDSLTVFQAGREFEFRRVDSSTKALPTLEDVLSLVRSAEKSQALRDAGAIRIEGTFSLPYQGLEGSIWYLVSGERFSAFQSLGPVGDVRTWFDGNRAFSESDFAPFHESTGSELDETRLSHPAFFLGAWDGVRDHLQVIDKREKDGEVRLAVRATSGNTKFTFIVDAATGDVVRLDGVVTAPNGITVPLRMEFADFRDVKGLRVPFSITIHDEGVGKAVMTVTQVETGVHVTDGDFQPRQAHD